ncbi:protein CrcB [Bacteroidales bacterium 6E]|nr:protein CrcB [Bacteroidales bacterium 6E]
MLRNLLIVGTGGLIGTVMRYLVQVHIEKLMGSTFPLGTFLINILGSFIIGVVYGLVDKGNIMGPEWRQFLAVGLCGGFTTFSTFSADTLNLIKDNSFVQMLLYTGGSVLFGLLAVYFGIILARTIL